MKAKYILSLLAVSAVVLFGSCSDFFDQDSDHVQYTDDYRLHEPGDTIYALTGIMNKMQALGDRTVLLGELRGDLVDLTTKASADLRQIADFAVTDSNAYNSPKDYYAVINNCNLYIARCDTAVKNNRNEYIFKREYAAVKAYRAWTYLQLALNYGKVPFVTTPITTETQANAQYEYKDINGICEYFIKDLRPLVDVEMPGLGTIGSVDSRMLYFPISILLGDLELWSGQYKQAALDYYHYLTIGNGYNGYMPVGEYCYMWAKPNWTTVTSRYFSWSSESYNDSRELITMIAGDSIQSQGHYSQLRHLFNSSKDNDYQVSIVPSKSLLSLSQSQKYCYIDPTQGVNATPVIAPNDLSYNRSGDLRLPFIWSSRSMQYNGRTVNDQSISKFATRNIHIYRCTMVYLRMAEALNRAGYPHFAYQILAKGVNNDVMKDSIMPYYPDKADSTYLAQFNFPVNGNKGYVVREVTGSDYNTIGIHSRGCGWSEFNPYYRFPVTEQANAADSLNYEIEKVEDMIVDENALECCFEGTRFYDLMRVALRRNDPAYLADRVYARRGAANVGEMKGVIRKDLYNTANWFLSFKGKIGF